MWPLHKTPVCDNRDGDCCHPSVEYASAESTVVQHKREKFAERRQWLCLPIQLLGILFLGAASFGTLDLGGTLLGVTSLESMLHGATQSCQVDVDQRYKRRRIQKCPEQGSISWPWLCDLVLHQFYLILTVRSWSRRCRRVFVDFHSSCLDKGNVHSCLDAKLQSTGLASVRVDHVGADFTGTAVSNHANIQFF